MCISFQCFYIPKCRLDRAELQNQVEEVKNNLDAGLVGPSSCLTDRTSHPGDAILNRRYTSSEAPLVLLWPGLMLAGGALLVVLVKPTQHLAHLSAQARRAARQRGGPARCLHHDGATCRQQSYRH